MGRRTKEEPYIHRRHIAEAAGELFEVKGIDTTSMNEIAVKAGYSKATLYVYFHNKEEIVGYLVLNSMIKLKEYLTSALESEKDFKNKYLDLCQAMVLYQEEYPFYFSMALDQINIDFEHSDCEESERETFQVGEEINTLLSLFARSGIEQGAFKSQLNIKSVLFSIWGMLSGFIQLATNKQEYISQEIHMTKKEFLENGFLFLYDAIEKK
ncbi:MAG: TetR/AcrR family transcriptional regulator [Lachnospiraceae bacterium]|nr:TetR/AcrR family transcriptional regulator [Lachnospiraceae bacterium]